VLALTGCQQVFGLEPPRLVDGGRSDAPRDARGDASDAGDDAPPSAPHLVQSASTASPAGQMAGSLSLDLPAAVAMGDLLAVFVSYDSGATLTSVSDDRGNIFTIANSVADATNSQIATMAFAKNIKGGSGKVHANFSGPICCRILIVHEVAGVNTLAPFDGFAGMLQTSPGTGTDAVSSSPLATTRAPDYMFAVTTNSNDLPGQSITAGTGFTKRESLTPTGGNATLSEDMLVSVPGASSATFTYSMNGPALTAAMAFSQ
jgi:hypothetical protein